MRGIYINDIVYWLGVRARVSVKVRVSLRVRFWVRENSILNGNP
jgi:hypothetical protein